MAGSKSHISEKSGRLTRQAYQVKTSVGTWSQHRVTCAKFGKRQTQQSRRQERRIRADDASLRMGLKQAAEGNLQPLAEVAPALGHQLPISAAGEFRDLSARRKKPANGLLGQLIDLRDGIQNQRALKFCGSARPEERNQPSLGAARNRRSRENRNR